MSEGKPSAQPLLALCKQANVVPEDCVIVGDTSADTGMGRNANAGMIVGVLTGTGTHDYLLNHGADTIIPNIQYLSQAIASFSSMRCRCGSSSSTSNSSISELTAATYKSDSEDSESSFE